MTDKQVLIDHTRSILDGMVAIADKMQWVGLTEQNSNKIDIYRTALASYTAEPLPTSKAWHICDLCDQDQSAHSREDLFVTPEGRWLCETCADWECAEGRLPSKWRDYPHPPELFAGPPAASRVPDDSLKIIKRLVDWDIRYPVNCDDGYAGLTALNEIIADGRKVFSAEVTVAAKQVPDGYRLQPISEFDAYHHLLEKLEKANENRVPDGLVTAVNRLLDSDGSRGCYDAVKCYDAHHEIEHLLATASIIR
jgi:hypothetical protein